MLERHTDAQEQLSVQLHWHNSDLGTVCLKGFLSLSLCVRTQIFKWVFHQIKADSCVQYYISHSICSGTLTEQQ